MDERPWTLWGSHPTPAYLNGTVIALHAGTKTQVNAARRARQREDNRWLLAVYATGDEPTGLRLQAAERTLPN